jgi:hypothetical protein
MKPHLHIVASLTFAFSCIHAQTQQDANPVDADAILKMLGTIKQTQETSAATNKAQLAQQFLVAAGNPSAAISYYEDAIRATKFAGESREGTQFLEWKKAEADHLKSKSFRDALTFHLNYLGLTMRRSSGEEAKKLLPELINYAQQVLVAESQGGGVVQQPVFMNRQPRKGPSAESLINPRQAPPALDNELMKPSLNSSLFVKWLQIDSYISGIDEWELSPGNVDGIYEKTILPLFRQTKDPRLFQYWDERIQRESNEAAKSGRNFDMDKFNQGTKPQLLWKRAQEYLAIDLKNRAVTDMVAVIKAYPSHPDSLSWIEQVEQVLKDRAAATAPPKPAAPPVTAAPQATPQL